jgi:hypothetical protein
MIDDANTAQADSGEDHAGSDGQSGDQPRRRYHPRPRPRRAVDVAGINHTYWLLVLAVLILIFIP